MPSITECYMPSIPFKHHIRCLQYQLSLENTLGRINVFKYLITELKLRIVSFSSPSNILATQFHPISRRNGISLTQCTYSFLRKISLDLGKNKNFKKSPKVPKQYKSFTSAKVAANTGSV